MPALTFLAAVGLVLIALLFVADATLEPGSPAIVTSQRSGLPAPQYHNSTRTVTNTPTPAPDMTSQAVLAAQPKSTPDITANIGPAALAARAPKPRTKASVSRATDRPVSSTDFLLRDTRVDPGPPFSWRAALGAPHLARRTFCSGSFAVHKLMSTGRMLGAAARAFIKRIHGQVPTLLA
jgi:hypothetical protein